MSAVEGLLDAFEALADNPWGLPFVYAHDGGGTAPQVVISVCVHGDEVGPLPAAIRLVRELRAGRLRYDGRAVILVGNPEAVRAGRRFLDSDLNRVFLPEPPDDREGRRARALQPVLGSADLFLDLHQTATPTSQAFWTLPWSARDEAWVLALDAASLWLTRAPGQGFSPGTCCADEYVRQQGRPGLTLELSERGLDPATERAAFEVMQRLLALAGRPELPPATGRVRTLVTAHAEPFDDPALALKPGLCNLRPVQAGELLTAPGSPERSCPVAGWLVFPKYPARDAAGRALDPRPGELYRVVVEMPASPRETWGFSPSPPRPAPP